MVLQRERTNTVFNPVAYLVKLGGKFWWDGGSKLQGKEEEG
jgi:hypothetical protein